MKLKQILYVKKKNKSSRTNAFFSSEDNFIKNYGSENQFFFYKFVFSEFESASELLIRIQTQLINLDRSGKLIRIPTDQDRIRIRDTV